MFDDLLKTRRGEYTLLEWADRDGWLNDIEELAPFFIALLVFPYVRIDKEEEPESYRAMENDFLALCDAITGAANSGELPSQSINLYYYDFPFRFDGPILDAYIAPLTLLYVNQRKFRECHHKPCLIPLIHRDDFKQWLIRKGKWPLPEDCLLRKWFTDDKNGQPGSTPSYQGGFSIQTTERSDEWREMILAVIERYQTEFGTYPKWVAFWGYLSANPPIEFKVSVKKGKRGVRETIVEMGEFESITKTNLKKRFERLVKSTDSANSAIKTD
jgi:hypothetical protein